MPLAISLERICHLIRVKSPKRLRKMRRCRSFRIPSSSTQHTDIQVRVDVQVTRTVEILNMSPLNPGFDSFTDWSDDRDTINEDFYSAYSVLVPTLVDSPFQSPRRIHGYSSHLSDSCYQDYLHGHHALESPVKGVSTKWEQCDEDLEDDTIWEWVTEPFESRCRKLVESGILVPA